MKLRTAILSLLFLGAPLLNMQAQDTDSVFNSKLYSNSIGVSASYTSGYGFSYSRYINRDVCFEITGFYWLDKTSNSSYSEKEKASNIGAQLQYDFYRINASRFYAYMGGMYYYYKFEHSDASNKNYNDEEMFSIGPGIGWEFKVVGRITMAFDFGLRYYNHKDFNNGQTMNEAIYPSMGTGLYFRF